VIPENAVDNGALTAAHEECAANLALKRTTVKPHRLPAIVPVDSERPQVARKLASEEIESDICVKTIHNPTVALKDTVFEKKRAPAVTGT